MMRNLRRTTGWAAGALGTAIVLALLAAAAPSASAGERPAAVPARQSSLYPPSVLVLTVAQGTHAQPVLRAVALRCGPLGGDHPAPVRACAALTGVGGDFTRLHGTGLCTLEYRPTTVTARGVWRGSLITKQRTYPNRCALLRATGAVFAF